jgi:hypothetical protein
LRVPTTGEIAAELTATAEPPLTRPDQAEQRCAEASAVAVNACVEDTKGQTCYICLDGATEEGLVRGCACRGGAGFAHLSCLAKQAQVAVERGSGRGFERWHTCRLCEQEYHGVVRCALGWACWKTYVCRPEDDFARSFAMTELGNGLSKVGHNEDALSVQEAELSMRRRLGASEDSIFIAQNNLTITYEKLGRHEETLSMRQEIYSGSLKLFGHEHSRAISAALNYAVSLNSLQRFKEAKSLIRKTIPVVKRVFGEDKAMLKTSRVYAWALCEDPVATPDDLREAIETLAETKRIARRVFGDAHPLTLMLAEDIRRVCRRARARYFPQGAQAWRAKHCKK